MSLYLKKEKIVFIEVCEHGNKENECNECAQEHEYLENLRWEENMNSLYEYNEGGFCDGFTKN